MNQELREKIKLAVPHLLVAMEEAELEAGADGSVELAVICKKANGGGRLTCSFRCKEFLTDLIALLELTDEELIEGKTFAKANSILYKFSG